MLGFVVNVERSEFLQHVSFPKKILLRPWIRRMYISSLIISTYSNTPNTWNRIKCAYLSMTRWLISIKTCQTFVTFYRISYYDAIFSSKKIIASPLITINNSTTSDTSIYSPIYDHLPIQPVTAILLSAERKRKLHRDRQSKEDFHRQKIRRERNRAAGVSRVQARFHWKSMEFPTSGRYFRCILYDPRPDPDRRHACTAQSGWRIFMEIFQLVRSSSTIIQAACPHVNNRPGETHWKRLRLIRQQCC